MGDAEKVRASRDGDRFHYYWAARRALCLLDLIGDLEVVGVEGLPEGEEVEGEEVIDVAEYYGGHDAATCTKLRYAQLKHSTMRTGELIVASELKNTLEKFAEIYRGEMEKGREEKLVFVFVANRTLNDKVRLSLEELAAGAGAFSHKSEAELLRGYMGFGADVEHEVGFCRRFEVEDGGPGIADMEQLLRGELQQFLPGGGTGTEMSQLMETVSRCATSLADKQTLKAGDILVALRTTDEELFPARSAIERLDHVIHTQDVDDVTAELRNGPNNKVLLTAVGGVGKSILASVLKRVLPEGSVTIVYDCFAGGDYRKVTSQRHEHRIALTQISNELAAEGRCTPLIPTMAADSDYTRVFMRRIDRAAEQLTRDNPEALLTVVIDAADNAAMAAEEQQQRTFVTDLFREDWPANCRLVQLCRPERKHLLNVPKAGVTEMSLVGFQKRESLEHLRTRFPDATDEEGAELHVLSDGNPRVQAMAMENAGSVAEALAAIQIARTTPGEVLDSLLAKQVQDVADQHLLPGELSRLCEALATLHPPMPLDDLAGITEVDADAIRSFAVALGRGLHAAGNTLQFRDEPTETWFRRTHGLEPARRREFAMTVRRFAARSPYVASTLPQLLFEADLLNELVELALSDTGLPDGTGELQAQEIARSRARFALCAMLRAGRNADAALLAVRAGDMSSGHSRKMKAFRTHTDLTARFLEADVIDTLCSGRELATDWPGSNLHVEAALLSHIDQFKDMARSRLRSAFNNFGAILRLPENGRSRLRGNITANEVADLAMVATNIDGPEGGLQFMRRWRPNGFVRSVATKLCARLADAGRYDDLAGLIVASKRHKHLQVAVAETMFEYNIIPPDEATEALVEMLRKRKKPFKRGRGVFDHEPDIRGVVWVLVHGLPAGLLSDAEVLRILDIHLPGHLPDGAGSRLHTSPLSSLLLAYALRARLTGSTLRVEDIASENLLKLLEEKEHSSDQRARDFNANIPGLLPWADCSLAAILDDDAEEVIFEFDALASNDLKSVSDYNTPFVFLNAVAEIATRILTLLPRADLVEKFASWHEAADGPLTRSRLTVARIASRSPHLETFGLEVVTRGVDAVQRDRTDADTRVESLIDLARTLLAVNDSEARAVFDAAVNEAERVGDDLYARWQSLTNTAKALATGTEPDRAYRLFQIGEELDRAHDSLDTTELAKRLRGMHEPTYFAATSRARDRRTLDFGLMLAPAFKGAAGPGPERLGLLALYAFEPLPEWKVPVTDLSPACAAMATSVFEAFTRYERAPGEVPEESYQSPSIFGDREKDPPVDQAVRFADSDFTTEDAWNEALSELGWRTEERRALADFALDKHPNRRPEVLDALGRATRATENDLARLAQAAAARQPQTLALKGARERLGTTLATRFARHICTRAYNDGDVAAVAEATGTTVTKLTQIAFRELGRSAHQLTYRDYFLLASHVANTLDTVPAGAVFDALANLFEDLAPSDTSSDGPSESLPSPPANSASCVAGVIWAALGDMASESRWRAAHAVLLLVRVGCKDELDALARLADGTESVAPFLDVRFPFYTLHSRMWLLLALARAAKEPNAATLTGFTTWLTGVVRGPHHAANQVLAQRTLVELSERDLISLEGADADVLTRRVVANWVELDYKEQQARPNPLTYGEEDEDAELERRRFFFDFERYWCRDVAEIFGSTEEDIARRVAGAATRFDGYDVFAAEKDPRSSAGVYDQRRSYPDHSSWPGEDTHSFYMAIHALLTVAAELAETEAAYKEPESSQDSYTDWLARFLPKRPDGRWLADRRDPPPTPPPDGVLAAHTPKATWPWTLSKSDFEKVAGVGRGWVTVWANGNSAHSELSEDRTVDSALVPHETARSLLVALQTSPQGPYSLRMPTTDEHYDRPDKHPFELIPWLNTAENHYGIDERDERGAGIRFPPTGPGENIITRFDLTTDDDQRVWFDDDVQVFRSRVWSNMGPGHYDREAGTRGEQFEVHLEFLKTVLQEFDMTLILQVGLRRNRHRPYYDRREEKDDEFDWLEWSGKVYLIDPRGRWLEY